MDIQKSKVLLKKINALHDSAIAFDGTFSKLERDLILQYVRDFYEVLSDQDTPAKSVVPTPTLEPQVVQATPTIAAQPVAQEIPTPPPAVAEEVIKPRPEPAVVIPATPAPEVPIQVATPSVTASPVKLDTKFNVLFEEGDLGDMSAKYAKAPLADISKGMGINDRILMINSLFGGDQQKFTGAIEALNKLSSMEDAKGWLASGPAKNQDWPDESRLEIAKRFVALVRRRYL